MAIRHIKYTAISSSTRKIQGHRLLLTLRDALRNPAITNEQRILIEADIADVNAWIAGTKATVTPGVPEHLPGPPPEEELP